jgi:uncharacterized protein
MSQHYRKAIEAYIRQQALPPDKLSHQPRLYRVALEVSAGEGRAYDEDIVHAGAWLHDLGVFIGHRPEKLDELARWDNVAYAMTMAPGVLRSAGFPEEKILAVVEVIRTHQPSAEPTCYEGELLRDADILEQLGAVAVLRTVSKVGRDTRFIKFSDALNVLRKNLENLPQQLRLNAARRLAAPRVEALTKFLEAAEFEAGGVGW